MIILKPIFKTIAVMLNKPTRQGIKVNLDKISRYANDNGNVIIPGKVLSTGDLTKKVNIIAYSFSESALDKIAKNGKAILLADFVNKKMEAKGLQILK